MISGMKFHTTSGALTYLPGPMVIGMESHVSPLSASSRPQGTCKLEGHVCSG